MLVENVNLPVFFFCIGRGGSGVPFVGFVVVVCVGVGQSVFLMGDEETKLNHLIQTNTKGRVGHRFWDACPPILRVVSLFTIPKKLPFFLRLLLYKQGGESAGARRVFVLTPTGNLVRAIVTGPKRPPGPLFGRLCTFCVPDRA